MVSKKLLLMTFFALSCAANSSLAAEKYKISPKTQATIYAYAKKALVAEVNGDPGKRRYKKLVCREANRVLQNKLKFPERKPVVLAIGEAFDAAYKEIEERRFARGQKSREIICNAEDAVRDASALNANDLRDAAQVHAQLTKYDPANLKASFMRTVKGAIRQRALRVPVDFRKKFEDRTKQEYAKEVKKAVKRLEN